MKAGSFSLLLEIVGARVDALVEVVEQFGDRLDALVMLAGRGVKFLSLLEPAGLHGIRETPGLLDEIVHFLDRRRPCIRQAGRPDRAGSAARSPPRLRRYTVSTPLGLFRSPQVIWYWPGPSVAVSA